MVRRCDAVVRSRSSKEPTNRSGERTRKTSPRAPPPARRRRIIVACRSQSPCGAQPRSRFVPSVTAVCRHVCTIRCASRRSPRATRSRSSSDVVRGERISGQSGRASQSPAFATTRAMANGGSTGPTGMVGGISTTMSRRRQMLGLCWRQSTETPRASSGVSSTGLARRALGEPEFR
jgi:hypothetical protein